MDWLILVASGTLEAVWAQALGATEGFKRLKPSIVFIVSLALSLFGLAFAMKTLPTGTAYAVWVGIGASLTVSWSMLKGDEPRSIGRILLILLLVGSVIGLKVVS